MLHEPLIIRGHEQPNSWLLTDLVTPLLGGRDTNGKFTVLLDRVPPGTGTPPHVHAHDDEGFFILDGEVTFLRGDELIVARSGDFVWAPHGIVHCFKCTSDTPATMLLMVTPSSFHDFVGALGKPAHDAAVPPAIAESDIAELMRIAPQFGITMLLAHPMPTTPPVAIADKRSLWVMGEHVTTLATAAQTGGQFTVADIVTAPAGGPPPHAHTREDELFYVIDGRHEVLLGERIDIAGPGDLVCVPRGTRHRYTNTGDTAGRLLSVHTPGGFEAFFDEVGVDAATHVTAPQLPPPPAEALHALLNRHGMTA